MQFSEHFGLAELTHTGTGLPNVAPPQAVTNLAALCVNVLEPIRTHFGKPVHVNSGYRSPAVNKAVGSKPTSDHARGCAADIEIPGVSNLELARWIENNLTFKQVILENFRPPDPSSGWVHCSFVPGANRKQALVMTMGSHGPVYSVGLPR